MAKEHHDDTRFTIEPYEGPAGGWGSVRSLGTHLLRQESPGALVPLARQNKPGGFACVSCAWAKPARSHLAEFCENGAKATFSELTSDRVDDAFFAKHTLTELRRWDDHHLEIQGRLTRPMRYDAASDCYVPATWDEAFTAIGSELRALRATPDATVFYASGRASLETSYMYALMARLYGTNNLPDSSNMCHETTSVALQDSIGVPVGTVSLTDFEDTDCLLFLGQNVGSNSPRMLHPLQAARERGVPVIVFNPLRERGLERFANPQRPGQMLTADETSIATQYHQVRAGGDVAALMGLCKALIDADDDARAAGRPRVLDTDFIDLHTHGFEAFAAHVRATAWADIEAGSGLPRTALETAAEVYARSDRVIGVYGMGLTQHKRGIDNVHMLVNLLLLRGNIGRPGAGVCPVRGHSNVQGQRTVGIAEKPELVPLDRLAAQYGFEPPRHQGLTTVDACRGVLDGSVKAFIGLGGNFVRAVPETAAIEAAWPRLQLTVQVATKLNRSHLFCGRSAWLLPCLGRIEVDRQASGPQVVTVEDSTSHFHASRGQHAPASEHLLSEPAIVAGIARAALDPVPAVDWQAWVDDYSRVRDAIEETYPDIFRDFNRRMDTPGGFPKPLAARERIWKTDVGRAVFHLPQGLDAAFPGDGGADVLRLITLRSNDQFNTTVYGYDDRFRGVNGTRHVLFIHRDDMQALGLVEGERVALESAAGDGVQRRLDGLRVTAYDIPRGCVGGYYPECNVLMPLWQHDDESKVPAAKAVPVRVVRSTAPSMPG
ncbi:MAG: FdhF/YdeP family oxidoreductase [Burkholderiales bacterium]|nr:FdhF/YdeP family oxidoreductase [Burkholderiales bacterium]